MADMTDGDLLQAREAESPTLAQSEKLNASVVSGCLCSRAGFLQNRCSSAHVARLEKLQQEQG